MGVAPAYITRLVLYSSVDTVGEVALQMNSKPGKAREIDKTKKKEENAAGTEAG